MLAYTLTIIDWARREQTEPSSDEDEYYSTDFESEPDLPDGFWDAI